VRTVLAFVSILGLMSLVFLFGAAVIYFQLPPADFLDKAFTGAVAWYEQGRAQGALGTPAGSDSRWTATVDERGKAQDGFTLYTTTQGPRAALIDMRGQVVHHWELPFSKAWPHAPHVKKPLPDSQVHWFRCHVFANGDLLAIYHADGDTPYGYGLVKVDKESKLLWAYPCRVHHDVDIGEDGTIYTLTQKLVGESDRGPKFLPPPYLEDSLVLLSPEGRELQTISISEALGSSPYALLLNSVTKCSAIPGQKLGDFLHANSVKVLRQALAPKFPLFKPGQVLISLRDLDTLAVLDPKTRGVTWAASGPWRVQHDAEFLDNGHILLYDNFGALRGGSRILELDPMTQAIPWAYSNENAVPFSAFMRGGKQRLANGNTLIVDPDHGRLFEVTQNKKIVWESTCPLAPDPEDKRHPRHAVTSARRYSADELTFLKGIARPRPE
jgi:hypothetical protein